MAPRSIGWSTVRVPNIGHFQAILGSKKRVSRLLNGPLGLSVTVALSRSLRDRNIVRLADPKIVA